MRSEAFERLSERLDAYCEEGGYLGSMDTENVVRASWWRRTVRSRPLTVVGGGVVLVAVGAAGMWCLTRK